MKDNLGRDCKLARKIENMIARGSAVSHNCPEWLWGHSVTSVIDTRCLTSLHVGVWRPSEQRWKPGMQGHIETIAPLLRFCHGGSKRHIAALVGILPLRNQHVLRVIILMLPRPRLCSTCNHRRPLTSTSPRIRLIAFVLSLAFLPNTSFAYRSSVLKSAPNHLALLKSAKRIVELLPLPRQTKQSMEIAKFNES